MSQINKIKMLVEMLEENVNKLEEHPTKVKEWEKKRAEYLEKYGKDSGFWGIAYPAQGTSQSHIRDIAKLLRKELLKL